MCGQRKLGRIDRRDGERQIRVRENLAEKENGNDDIK